MIRGKKLLRNLFISVGVAGVFLFGSAITASAERVNLTPVKCTPTSKGGMQVVYVDKKTGVAAVFVVEAK